MAFCRHCGKQLEEGVRFCPDCGAPTEGDLRNAPVREKIIIGRRAVSGATYNEIAFAGGIYHSRLSRIFLYFATLVCIICNAVMIVAVGPGFEMVKSGAEQGGCLLF